MAEHEGAVEPAIEHIFRALTSRHPTDAQADILLQAYDEQRKWFDDHPDQAAAYLAVGDHPTDPTLRPTEVAAMTAVAQMVMNFDAFQMKR